MLSTLCLCDDFDEDPSSLCIAQPLVPMWQFVNFADTCAYAGTISSHLISSPSQCLFNGIVYYVRIYCYYWLNAEYVRITAS